MNAKQFFKPTKYTFIIMGLCLFAAASWMSLVGHRYPTITQTLIPGFVIYNYSRNIGIDACIEKYCLGDTDFPCECGLGNEGLEVNWPLVISLSAAATLASWYLVACILSWLIVSLGRSNTTKLQGTLKK